MSVPWLKTVMVKVTLDPDTNGVEEPVANVLIKARSKNGDGGGGGVPVPMIIPVAIPVLVMILVSPLPQVMYHVLANTVPEAPVTLKVTSIDQLVFPVNDGIIRVNVLPV